jgi:histidine triad (HIT) family protein
MLEEEVVFEWKRTAFSVKSLTVKRILKFYIKRTRWWCHAPVHLLFVPKKHIRSVNDLTGADQEILSELIMVAKEMAREHGVSKSGYKLLYNVEKGGGQVVFHLHLHLLGGRL